MALYVRALYARMVSTRRKKQGTGRAARLPEMQITVLGDPEKESAER